MVDTRKLINWCNERLAFQILAKSFKINHFPRNIIIDHDLDKNASVIDNQLDRYFIAGER